MNTGRHKALCSDFMEKETEAQAMCQSREQQALPMLQPGLSCLGLALYFMSQP
jgi:hypothetical protein